MDRQIVEIYRDQASCEFVIPNKTLQWYIDIKHSMPGIMLRPLDLNSKYPIQGKTIRNILFSARYFCEPHPDE